MKKVTLLLLALLSITSIEAKQTRPKTHSFATIIADNLLNPRGFTFGPDGALYVAEPGATVASTIANVSVRCYSRSNFTH